MLDNEKKINLKKYCKVEKNTIIKKDWIWEKKTKKWWD